MLFYSKNNEATLKENTKGERGAKLDRGRDQKGSRKRKKHLRNICDGRWGTMKGIN